jgi:hypothetical protein
MPASRDNKQETFLDRLVHFFKGDQPDYEAIHQRQLEREQKEQALINEVGDSRLINDNIKPIAQLKLGSVHIHGMFKQVSSSFTRNRLRVTRAILYDETGSVVTVWFNANVGPLIKPLTIYEVTGTFKLSNQRLQINSPKFTPLSEGCSLEPKPESNLSENGAAQKELTIDELNLLVERELLEQEPQSVWNGQDLSKLGSINDNINTIPVKAGLNKSYQQRNYSDIKHVPEGWKFKDINLNSTKISPDSFWGNLRRQVFSRDNYSCQTTGCNNEELLTVHHIKPLSIGGSNQLPNLKTLCWGHHELIHGRKIYNTGRSFGDLNNYGKNYSLSPKIKTINEALERHHDVVIEYNDIKHIHTNRRITPRRLYIKNNKKYLEAFCHLRNAKRTFRVARMQTIQLT